MRTIYVSSLCLVLLFTACSRNSVPKQSLSPKAYGTQIVEVSGGKQVTEVGSDTPQPVVVQINGADGNPVTGALVYFHGEGIEFSQPLTLTDSSGQATTSVQLGSSSGTYQIVTETPKAGGGAANLNLQEIALGYEQKLGRAVNEMYCIRCHDSESTPERVSNFDNLSPAPHLFTDGATLNSISDTDLINITTHGGPALGKSAQMPAYGTTLTPAEIKAVVAYMRAVADPPYQPPGVKYAKE